MKNRKGITLIPIVIVIIIILIIAGLTVLVLTEKNGLIVKLKQSENIKMEMQEQFMIIIDELQKEKNGKASLEDITESYLREKMVDYEVDITSDENMSWKKVSIIKGQVQKKFKLDEQLNIVDIENITNGLKFSYETFIREENKIKILINVEEKQNGIEKVVFPDEDALICNKSKKVIAIDYEIEIGVEYKIKIILGNGEEKEEIILLDYYYRIEKDLDDGLDIDNKEVKISYNKPYQATIRAEGEYVIGTILVTMGEEKIPVDIQTGKIYIENVTGDIKIIAKKFYSNYLVKDGIDNTLITGGWEGVPYFGRETGTLTFDNEGGYANFIGISDNTIYTKATVNPINWSSYKTLKMKIKAYNPLAGFSQYGSILMGIANSKSDYNNGNMYITYDYRLPPNINQEDIYSIELPDPNKYIGENTYFAVTIHRCYAYIYDIWFE